MTKNKNSSGGFHYAWIILIATILILGTYMPIVTSLANKWQIFVTTDLGFSRSAFSVNTTIVQAVGIFFGPIISKRLGGSNFRRIWLFFAVLFGLSVMGYSIAKTPMHFYILSFLIGLSFISTTSIPMTMMINNWFIKSRGLATSLAFAGVSAGGFILSPVVTWLLTNFGWQRAYLIYGIILLVIAVVMGLFVIRLKPEDMGMKPYGYEEAAAAAAAENDDDSTVANTSDQLNIDVPVSQSFTKAFFILLLVGAILNGLANGGGLQFSPAIFEARGADVEAWTVSGYLLAGIFGKILLGAIDDRFGYKVSLWSGMGAMALSFFIMLMIDQTWAPYALIVVFGLGLATGTVLPPIITSAIFDGDRYSEAYGYVTSATQIGTAIGPLVVPMIYDAVNSYNPAWVLMIIISVLAAVAWHAAYISGEKFVKQK